MVGRPDTFTVLAALAGVTDRVGLAGTVNTTFNEPFEVARQFATLDHLSDGRAGWNMVTSSTRSHGENFRRGGFLDCADRYRRAEEFITVARAFWDSWADDAVRADAAQEFTWTLTGSMPSSTTGPSSTCAVLATLPAGPQGHPVLLQAGDSADGRAFGAKHADALFTLHSALEAASATTPTSRAGQRHTAEIPHRLLKVFPAATFVLGDTPEEAVDKARHIRLQQVSGPTAIAMLEQVWQRDLSAYDPDGPLPEVEPVDDPTITQGRVRHGDPKAVAAAWRERAEAENLSIRELVIAVTSRQQFVGTPAQVADEIDIHVQADACDGFILVPAPDATRPRRVRRPGGAPAPGARQLPDRLHRAYPARPSRPIG